MSKWLFRPFNERSSMTENDKLRNNPINSNRTQCFYSRIFFFLFHSVKFLTNCYAKYRHASFGNSIVFFFFIHSLHQKQWRIMHFNEHLVRQSNWSFHRNSDKICQRGFFWKRSGTATGDNISFLAEVRWNISDFFCRRVKLKKN